MIEALLSPTVQAFIQQHSLDDTNALLLKYKTVDQVPIASIVDQIIGRRKAKQKFPTWHATEDIIYPPSLNLEQASSEQAAITKVKLIRDEIGTTRLGLALDLTGGFGVDSYFLSKVFEEVHVVEPNTNLLDIAKHNHQQLGAYNVRYYNVTAEQFLLANSSKTKDFDLIFIDPSRRRDENKRVVSFSQCDPDVTVLQSNIWYIGGLVVKASPLLDIEQALRQLEGVKKVFVLSVHNECKELLFYCEKNFEDEPLVVAINLNGSEDFFSFKLSDERAAIVEYHDPLTFLYEPNTSLLKSGAFKTLASRFNIYKLHPSTHLYTSDELIDHFPGRVFKIEGYAKPDARSLKTFFPDLRASIFTRNYPLTVDALRKKTRLKESETRFLIGCSGLNKKFLIVASKLNNL